MNKNNLYFNLARTFTFQVFSPLFKFWRIPCHGNESADIIHFRFGINFNTHFRVPVLFKDSIISPFKMSNSHLLTYFKNVKLTIK